MLPWMTSHHQMPRGMPWGVAPLLQEEPLLTSRHQTLGKPWGVATLLREGPGLLPLLLLPAAPYAHDLGQS